jgi:hypothetical protein
MQKALFISMLAVLSLASLVLVTPASATSDTGVCTDFADIVAGPGAGEAGLWLDDCIVSAATTLSVTYTVADAIFHRPVAKGCFDLGNIQATGSAVAKLSIKSDGNLYFNNLKQCSLLALEDRDGAFIPASRSDNGPVVVKNGDGSVTVHYICGVHGPAMHGTITLGAPAGA